jgi:ferredoxin
MRVSVDGDLCEANEVCVRFCPQVFRVDEDEKLAILVDPIPEDLRSAVEDAVRSCPRQALTLEN